MSARRDVLVEVARGLAVHRGARERVLRELAADLDGLYQDARAAGLDEEAAHARAAEFAQLDAGARAAMVEVHGPWHRRWSSGLSGPARTRLERLALTLSLVAVLLLGLRLWSGGRGFDATWPASTWLFGARYALLVTLIPWVLSAWRFHFDRDHRPDPYEQHALAARGLALVVAGLGLLGLACAVATGALELRDSGSTDGAALLRDQLVHLRSQLVLIATYLFLTTLALVVHARIVARARSMRAHEDALLDELAPDPASGP